MKQINAILVCLFLVAALSPRFFYRIFHNGGGSPGTNANIIQGRGKIPIDNVDAVAAIVVKLKADSEVYGGWHLAVPTREISCRGNGRIEVTLVGVCAGKAGLCRARALPQGGALKRGRLG